ncbi:glycosyltransferase family 39 protein [bacterium]|nr:glycosyltransferase family 39 protein [bacterium]
MKRRILFCAVLFLFIAIQSALFVWHSFPLTLHETDGLHYMSRSSGDIFQLNAFHGPGYSFAIRLLRLTGLTVFDAAKLVSIFSGLVFIISLWFILSRITGPYQAMAALVIAILNKSIVTSSNMILSDMLASACFITSIAILISSRRMRWYHYFTAGSLAGCAYLTRYIFIIGLVLPLLFVLFVASHKSTRQKIVSLAVFYAGFLGFVGPWFVYLYNLKDSIFWNNNHLNIAFKMVRNSQDWKVFPDITQFPDIWEVIKWNPTLFFRSWAGTIMSLPVWVLKLFPLIGIFLVAGVYVWSKKLTPERKIVASISCLYTLIVSLVWIEYRFLIPLIPICSLLIADGGYWLLVSVRERFFGKEYSFNSKAVIMIVASASILIVLLPTLKYTLKRFADRPMEYYHASEWLRDNSESDDLILAGKPHIAFFAGTKNMEFRSAGMDIAKWTDFPKILEELKPSFVIFDERYSLKAFSEFGDLIFPENKPFPGLLRHVYTVKFPKKVVVYEVF